MYKNKSEYSNKLIAILLPSLGGGGTEKVCIELARSFKKMGYSVEFIVVHKYDNKDYFHYQANLEFTIYKLDLNRFRSVPFLLRKYLLNRKPAALIASMWPLTTAAVLGRFLSGSKTRLLLIEHGVLSIQYAKLGILHKFLLRVSMVATYRFADAIVGVSLGVSKDVASLSNLLPGRVRTIYNPIKLAIFPLKNEFEAIEKLWDCPRGGRILTVGSLKDIKNHSLLLRAFKKIAKPSLKLMILGVGKNEKKLRNLANDLNITNSIIFAGFHLNTSLFYSTADLFVLTSDSEGFGNVIVEALSFGVSVVSTDCPFGPSEILQNGLLGKLTPVGDEEKLSEAMIEVLLNPFDKKMLMKRSLDFEPQLIAQQYLNLLGFK